MIRYTLTRAALLLLGLLVASVLIFLTLRVLPGDIAQLIAGTNSTPEQIDAIRERLGLNQPLPVQYLEWIGGVLPRRSGHVAADRVQRDFGARREGPGDGPPRDHGAHDRAAVQPAARCHLRDAPGSQRRHRAERRRTGARGGPGRLGRHDAGRRVRRLARLAARAGLSARRLAGPRDRVPLAPAAGPDDRNRRGRDAHAVRPQRHDAGRRPGLRPHGRREGPDAQRRPHPPRTAQRRPLGHHRARPAGRGHHRRRRGHRAALLPSGHRPDAGRRRQRERPAQGAGRAARAHRLRAGRSGSSSTWCTGSSIPGSGRRHDRGCARGRTRGTAGRAAVALDMAAAACGACRPVVSVSSSSRSS